jgi:hypothetical protein
LSVRRIQEIDEGMRLTKYSGLPSRSARQMALGSVKLVILAEVIVDLTGTLVSGTKQVLKDYQFTHQTTIPNHAVSKNVLAKN